MSDLPASPNLLAASPAWSGVASKPIVLAPGIALCAIVTAAAFTFEHVEAMIVGRAWLEALVLAILIGTAVRTLWMPSRRWQPGIAFSSKTLLEVAVMLLGASISFRTLADVGPALLFGIAGLVGVAITLSFAICRCLGLPPRMAMLIACGNSICGNSAIAAVAPVIGAKCDDVAASIGFTAVLGVLVVIGLPLLVPLAGFSASQFGVFAGLTVYAVPQVIAATASAGPTAVHIGTLVKLVRVLMLGPVLLALTLVMHRLDRSAVCREPDAGTGAEHRSARIHLGKVVPWFIVAFLALATLRTLELLPTAVIEPAGRAATVLTILSMAALGLGVDVRVVARAGTRVTAAVMASLVLLGVVGLLLIRTLGVA